METIDKCKQTKKAPEIQPHSSGIQLQSVSFSISQDEHLLGSSTGKKPIYLFYIEIFS